MIDLSTFPPWATMLFILAASGVVSWGIVELLKRLYIAYETTHGAREPWWWSTSLRALACLIGMAVGVSFTFVGVEVILSLIVGLCGGILNTTIVATVRSKLSQIPIPGIMPAVPGVVPGEYIAGPVVEGTSVDVVSPDAPRGDTHAD